MEEQKKYIKEPPWRTVPRLKEKVGKLETLTTRDVSLTDLENVRTFKERMNKAFVSLFREGHKRESEPKVISIVMGDVDNFKKINDTYGHQAGDKVLKVISKILKDSVRDNDSAARYGGEEFSLGFIGLGEEDTLSRMEGVRQAIEKLHITTDDGRVMPVTMSFGITSSKNARTLEGAIKQADTALYEAKGNGRNRTTLFTNIA
ncbi:MAG: GGDEF domain-containing protein [bacterium]|nr:GGDEF domain-containing protein [bacterium]